MDYHVASTPSCANAEDAEMEDARRRFESHDDDEDPHPFFKTVIMTARNQAHHKMDPAQLATLAALAAEDWDDFCSKMHIDRLRIPPVPLVTDAFVTHTHINLVQAQMESDLSCHLCADCGSSVSPDGPSYMGPHLSTTHDDPVALPRPSHLSEPISISSDGSKISGFTETSPAPHTRPAGPALDLDTPPPGDGVGWSVMGGKCVRSFASIAAARPAARPTAPPTLPPSAVQAAHGFLMKPQLDSLTRAQVVSAYNARFSPKLPACVSKDNAVVSFLEKASRPAASVAPLAPKPIMKTEFTLVYDSRAGDLSAPSGRRGDAASYVRAIQKYVKDAGTKQAELIGGRWTSQMSRNFVLTFNGNPSLDDVLRLHTTFARILGPHYSIVPSCGYTCVVLNSIPTMRESLGAPLPSAAALRTELARNAGLKDLILLGDSFWLTARHPNARHGSISVAFLDPDGTCLKDILRNPPFLFGNRTSRPRKYESRPLILQCECCWMLGHESSHCPRPKDTVVCPICAGTHTKDKHHKKCQAVSKHTKVYCTCPVICINCRRARKPAKGHSALSLSCPLCSKFRSPLARTGDSSDEEKTGVNIDTTRWALSPSPDIVMLSDRESPAPLVVAPALSL